MAEARDIAELLADDVWLTTKLAAYETDYPGLDTKGQGAFLIGELVYYAVTKLVLCHLGPDGFPDGGTGLKFTFPASGEVEVTFASESLRPTERCQRLEAIRDMVTELCEQIIPVLVKKAKLGKAAQWRLAADSLASAFLYTGRELGCEKLAINEATQILTMTTAPLSNSMTGFVDISVHHRGQYFNQTFIKRAGCCRYYVCDEGSYCSTCILKPPDEQVVSLRSVILDGVITAP